MPEGPQEWEGEAWRAFRAGRGDVAEQLLHRVVAAQPNNLQAAFGLGVLAAQRGDASLANKRMRQILAREDRFLPAIEWLATAAMQTGSLAEAEEYARRGLVLESRSATCLKVLGQCHISRNEFPAALETYDRAVRAHPEDPQLHFARGTVLRTLHRLSEALVSLEAAARTSPEALPELADLRIMVNQVQGVIAACSSFLERNPNSFRVNVLMARALGDAGRIDEADMYWNRAVACEPTPGEADLIHALHCATLGRLPEVEALASRAIEANPRRGKGYHVLFASRPVTPEDRPRIDRMENLLCGQQIEEADRVDLQYALGKAYDNLGDFQTAIKRFDEANALQRKLTFGDSPFDASELREVVDAQVRLLDRVEELGSGPSDLPKPICVVGMARSGTTIVDQILSCHHDVGSVGEQSFWLEYQPAIFDRRKGGLDAEMASQTSGHYLRLLAALAPGNSMVVDKNPANLFVIGLLQRALPSAKFVCTRRSAVDAALSIWMTRMHTQAPFVCDRAAIVFAYKECLKLMEACRNRFPANRYLEVRYEALIEDPEPQTRILLEFCGLPWDEACLRPERSVHAISTPSFWQARQPLYKTSINRWKNYEPWLGPFDELIGL